MKRLERHKSVEDKLNKEIDIVKLLKAQRLNLFVAKLFLKRHQRALVSSFKKYQIEDLDNGKANKSATNSHSHLDADLLTEPSMQLDDLQMFEKSQALKPKQLELLREINNLFSPSNNEADFNILYETTGYLSESQLYSSFWHNYLDYSDLMDDRFIGIKQDLDAPVINESVLEPYDLTTDFWSASKQ